MLKMNTNKRHAGALTAGLIICAMIARVLGQYNILIVPLGLVHTFICIGICIAWGISVNRRIVQASVRRYMLGVSIMAVFWFMARSFKYYFVDDIVIDRYLWYAYYLPMLTIPLFALLVAIFLGKPEGYRPFGWAWLLAIPAALSLLVMTNDLHQLVFSFPLGAQWTDDAYIYGMLYYLIWASELICVLAAFVIMLGKCRTAREKQYLPALLILLAIGYSVLYMLFSGQGLFKLLAGDMVMVLSLLVIAILESAIQCGFIQTNSGYAELFEAGTLGAQIVDSDNQLQYASTNAPRLEKETLQEAWNGSVLLDKNTLLKGQPIAGGQVLWQEDITKLTAVLEEMEKNRAAIAQNNHIEQENLRVQREIHALREKTRLYDMLHAKVAPQIDLLDALFARYNRKNDEAKRRKLLGEIAVVGAYIKRSGNLLFIGERSEWTDTAELSLCMEESFFCLRLMGVECVADIPGSYLIATRDAIRVYDILERILETAMEGLHCVWLKARVLQDSILFRLDLECEASLEAFSKCVEGCEYEDGIWSLAMRIQRAGDAA